MVGVGGSSAGIGGGRGSGASCWWWDWCGLEESVSQCGRLSLVTYARLAVSCRNCCSIARNRAAVLSLSSCSAFVLFTSLSNCSTLALLPSPTSLLTVSRTPSPAYSQTCLKRLQTEHVGRSPVHRDFFRLCTTKCQSTHPAKVPRQVSGREGKARDTHRQFSHANLARRADDDRGEWRAWPEFKLVSVCVWRGMLDGSVGWYGTPRAEAGGGGRRLGCEMVS